MSSEKKYYCRPASEFTIEELEKNLEDWRWNDYSLDDYGSKLFEVIKGRIKAIGAQAFLNIVRWMEAKGGYRNSAYFYIKLIGEESDCLAGQFDGLSKGEAFDAMICDYYASNKIAKRLFLEAAYLMNAICSALCRLGFVRDDIKEDGFLEDLNNLFREHLRDDYGYNDALSLIVKSGKYETYKPKDEKQVCKKIIELLLS